VTGTFTDAAGDNTDPDEVTGIYQDPSGNETTDAAPTNSAVGVYYFDITADEAGQWYYRIYGETSGGAAQGAAESTFEVSASEF
jgi:hypothetical protein